jgi:hypothetical protein
MCQAQMQLFDHSALFTFATLRVPWDPAMLGRLYRLGAPGGDPKAGASEQRRPGWQLTTALVRELAREVRDAGARFVLASQEVTHRSLDLEALAADGIIPIDLTVVTLDDPTARFKNDSHFNVKGHRIAADLLLPAIEQALATRRAAELSWLPGRGDGHDGR